MNSNNQVIKMALAIFAGAFIGSVVGVSYLEKSVWSLLLGIVCGGSIGYVFCAPSEFLRAVQRAWKATDLKHVVGAIAQGIIGIFLCLFSLCVFIADIVVGFGIFGAAMFAPAIAVGYVLLALSELSIWPVVLSIAITLAASIHAVTVVCQSLRKLGFWMDTGEFFMVRNARADWFRRVSLLFFRSLPFVAIPLLFADIWSTIYEICCSVGNLVFRTLIPVFWRFGVKIFQIAHSEVRVQSAVYAAIGVVVGWWTGSPLLGALAGASFGGLSYRFVTTRFLKPAAV